MTTEIAPYIEIDFEEVVSSDQKAQEAQAAGAFHKTPKGDFELVLRIVPPPASWMEWFVSHGIKPTPFFKLWKHSYKDPVSGKWITHPCPQHMAGMPCLSCALSDEYKSSAENTQSKADKKTAMDTAAKHRMLFNAVIRGREDLGPKILDISYPYGKPKGLSQWEKLSWVMQGAAKRNILTAGAAGYDVVWSRRGAGKDAVHSYVAYPEPRPLSEDPAKIAEWIANQPDLRTYASVPTNAMIKKIFEWARKEDDDTPRSDRVGLAPQSRSRQPTKSAASNFDDAFAVDSDFSDDDIPF